MAEPSHHSNRAVISVTVEVEVDIEAWAESYGREVFTRLDADVLDYVVNQLSQSAAAEEGAIVGVTA
jgi:hypothetical protein